MRPWTFTVALLFAFLTACASSVFGQAPGSSPHEAALRPRTPTGLDPAFGSELREPVTAICTPTISGYVRTAAGAPIPGIIMSGLPGNPSTGTNGSYGAVVPCNWSGTVTPVKPCYIFDPTWRSYSGVTSDYANQNYTGSIPTVTLPVALDATSLTWTTGGSNVWFGQTCTTHDGVNAGQSGSIGHNQESWMQTTVCGAGTLTFWWQVDSESDFDSLRFSLDGVAQAFISGSVAWQQKSFALGAGNHTLQWRYTKDLTVSVGADCGWVDQVLFTPTTVTLPAALDATNWVWTTGGSNLWFGQTCTTYDGFDAGQSGAISHNQESWMQTTIGGAGTLTFSWQVESESDFDFLDFLIDGQRQAAISGSVGWQQKNFTLGAGNHTLRWHYSKDGSVSSGSDCGWVDQVVFAPASALPPSIVSLEPQEAVVTVGGLITFRVTATGTPPLAYQWRYNGTPIIYETNSALLLANVQAGDSGNYTVAVTNLWGAVISTAARLTVVEAVPIRIYMQPLSRSVFPGTNVTFTVVAGGTPPLSYQWRRNGAVIPGATLPFYSIFNAQETHQGNYDVIVTNLAGAVISEVARLVVSWQPPPLIVTPPRSQVVMPGTNASFSVVADGARPLSYEWLFNEGLIQGATNSILQITNVQAVHGGNYAARVTNPFGSVTSEVAVLSVRVSLTVRTNGNGRIFWTPPRTFFQPGETVTLTAVGNAGNDFYGWTGDTNASSNPLVLLMNRSMIVVGNFGDFELLTLYSAGRGAVTAQPDRAAYHRGELVTLTATPERWHGLSNWNDGVTANPRVITIGPSNVYTAFFYPTTALETLRWSNVSRLAPVGMPVVLVDGEFVVTGAVARLGSAEITLHTSFPNGLILYTLDGSAPSFRSPLYVEPFVLRRSVTIRALALDAFFSHWWEADPVQVNVEPLFGLSLFTRGGGGLAVTPASSFYRSNSLVTFSATPKPGWTLLQWLGHLTGSALTNTLTIRGDTCVEAIFGTGLSTAASVGGAVEMAPAATLHPYGQRVQVAAIPAPGYAFMRWGNAAGGTNNPLFFDLTNAAPAVSALFAPLNAGEAAISVIPDGFGEVRVHPSGNSQPSGRTVTLTALPTGAQSFIGWSGDANGTDNPLTIALNNSRIIRAHFSRQPHLAVMSCGQSADPSTFTLKLTGWPGAYLLEATTNLTDWRPLTVATNTFCETQFTDPTVTNHAQRFYRATRVE